ncbi:MAG: ABC transporter ATP-binding protein [Oscillospiraceae bacterium]|nr:ABC transporter ATP-binding protein [Oscillospiraceae bacterium]
MNAFEIKDVKKSYPGFELDLDLALPQGCILGLIGENGAGKSTTIKLLLGMLKPDAGSIRVLDRAVDDAFAPVREEIGVVLDEPAYPECLTAKQVGSIMADIYHNWDGAAYARLLEKLNVPSDKKFKDFSRGMKMKLSIAVALAHRAKLLVLDEPTSGLDPVVRDEVVELFSEFTRDENCSVLISSHIVSDLEKLCDYVAFLHKGKLLLCEEKDKLLEQYGLVLCTKEQLETLPVTAVADSLSSFFGVTALIRREDAPEDLAVIPVGLEDLFVTMIKGVEK